ncbi:MAG: hypothetical protein D6732_22580, partial [Methanobacteriota archaeon]
MLERLFDSLKIKQKIILMPIISAGMLLTIVLLILYLNNHNKNLTLTIRTRYYPLLEESRDIEIAFNLLQRSLQDAVALSDSFALLDADTLFENLCNKLETIRNQFPKEKIFFNIYQELQDYYPLAREVT